MISAAQSKYCLKVNGFRRPQQPWRSILQTHQPWTPYEQPRRVIEAICRLKEMKASKKAARCCGGGGGVRAGYRDLSLQMAKKRLGDVPEGADYIVTCCPLCIRNLRDAGGAEKVIDLVDLVAMAV